MQLLSSWISFLISSVSVVVFRKRARLLKKVVPLVSFSKSFPFSISFLIWCQFYGFSTFICHSFGFQPRIANAYILERILKEEWNARGKGSGKGWSQFTQQVSCMFFGISSFRVHSSQFHSYSFIYVSRGGEPCRDKQPELQKVRRNWSNWKKFPNYEETEGRTLDGTGNLGRTSQGTVGKAMKNNVECEDYMLMKLELR